MTAKSLPFDETYNNLRVIFQKALFIPVKWSDRFYHEAKQHCKNDVKIGSGIFFLKECY